MYIPTIGDTFTYGTCNMTGCTCSAHTVHTAVSVETDSFESGGNVITSYVIKTNSNTSVVFCPGVNTVTKIN